MMSAADHAGFMRKQAEACCIAPATQHHTSSKNHADVMFRSCQNKGFRRIRRGDVEFTSTRFMRIIMRFSSYLSRIAFGAAMVFAATVPAVHAIETNVMNPGVGSYDGRIQAAAIPREEVEYKGKFAPGTIVVDSNEKRLYFVLPNNRAIRYGVGVGRPGFSWAGTKAVTRKAEWPSWTPPAQMLRRRPDLPRFMKGGEDNPLGARALYLGSSLYRIHGSNEPETIGQAVSSGCIRMLNADVIDLYERAKIGTRVVVMR
jgi:lipoprotein-anchoring transpeptidase ErfK/SrfK